MADKVWSSAPDLNTQRGDMKAYVFNYHYDGWKYRVPSEGYEAVAKDCNEVAEHVVEEYEKAVIDNYKKTNEAK